MTNIFLKREVSRKEFPFTPQFSQMFIRFSSIPILLMSIMTLVLCFKENITCIKSYEWKKLHV